MSSNGRVKGEDIRTATGTTCSTATACTGRRWTCDVCRVRAFDTFAAAVAHEKTCSGLQRQPPPPPQHVGVAVQVGGPVDLTLDRRNQLPSVVPPSASGQEEQQAPQPQLQPCGTNTNVVRCASAGPQQKGIPLQPSPPTSLLERAPMSAQSAEASPIVTVWNCDICRTAEFSTYAEAAEHEVYCSRNALRNSVAVANSLPAAMARACRPRIVEDERYWTCDVCATAMFLSYEEAVEHEKMCEGNPNAPVKSITTRRQMEEEDESQLTEPASIEDVNFWSCDKCVVASFPTFDEAAAHEKICRGTTTVAAREQRQPPSADDPNGTSMQTVAPVLPIDSDDSTDYEHKGTCAHHLKEAGKGVLLPAQRKWRQKGDTADSQIILDDDCSMGGAEVTERTATDIAINARKRALEKELQAVEYMASKEENVAHSTSRLGGNTCHVEPPTTKKMRTGWRKVEGLELEDHAHNSGVLDQDKDGNDYYLPPTGGVPLVSSQSQGLCLQLSRYYQLIVENLELCEVRGEVQSGLGQPLLLRCQNCKSNPHLNAVTPLSNITSWHKAVKQMASDHVVICPCLDAYTKQKVKLAQKTKIDRTLVAFCTGLALLYNMKNSMDGVVWGVCKPIQSNYISCPQDHSPNLNRTPPISCHIPRHLFMAPTSTPPAPKRMILSDYYYLQAAQYIFVLVLRKTPDANKISASLLPPNHPGLAIALRCKHCTYTKLLESIRECCSSCTYILNSHLRSCCKDKYGRRLDELKDSRHRQERMTAITMSKYVKHLMMNVYGMIDLEWNGVCGGVGFPSPTAEVLNRLVERYGCSSLHGKRKRTGGQQDGSHKDVPLETFALPMLLDEEVSPFSPMLIH